MECPLYVFFFNDTATTEIYTLSLHDALPISASGREVLDRADAGRPRGPLPRLPALHHRHLVLRPQQGGGEGAAGVPRDRKSTRLNSSHANISYAVFCLKKKPPNAVNDPHKSS